ncbi:sodium-translocating pyrophosphatase [Candidatus Bathyarchaeota archaeon]|nr:MAG: sodium-translocating pyrophosphatase [Candidatus Bathyarchaeota archaeon]TMI60339.1 MAG: sodium-translocating pyrophosphatase [Candidatus Bathyarchaeota archaeon]
MAFDPLLLTTSLAAVGVIASIILVLSVKKHPTGNAKMVAIWKAIMEGANAYLKRQFRTIGIIAVIIAFVILAAFSTTFTLSYSAEIAFSFLLGVTFSLVAAYIAMYSATNANVRSTAAAEKSTYLALRVATLGGGALGLAVISMSLLGLSILYAAFRDPGVLAGFGFGASLAALFAQLGGGIFTKSADVGADLVGKVEENFPEDDPRNPAAIADNVGDNVGDEAGRGADLFESLTAENLGGMIIGLIVSIILFQGISVYYVTMPLIVRSLGIIATFVGLAVAIFEKKFKNPIKPTRDGLLVASVVAAILMLIATWYVFGPAGLTPSGTALAAYALYGCMVSGLAAGLLIVLYTEYYTGSEAKSVITIAERSKSGPALTIMSGTAVGMISSGLPVITVAITLLISFGLGEQFAVQAGITDTFLGGVYGTTMATMGMLSTAGIVLTMDGLGPIVDNAGGIAEMSGAPDIVRERIEPLDTLGNTTKALTKGYAMGSAALASLLLFQAFVLEVARYQAKITDLTTITSAQAILLGTKLSSLGSALALNHPDVVIGALIGAMLPFVFSGTAINAVSVGAYRMVEEVRRQFREIPGLREGTAKPNYAAAVDISTRTALRLMVVPGAIPVVAPIVVGVFLGWAAVGALVVGATLSAIPLAIMMMWGGAAMDNAKKYVEAGHFGGKNTETHAATVVGDTVGDPWKDTAGPSLHILIKLLNTISLVFIPLFLVALISLA